jgi:hypothetical protein
MHIKMQLEKEDIYTLSQFEYQERVEDFLTTLENLYITKIEKNTPDGEMMSAMI